MAAIRLGDEVDNIESTLSSALMDTKSNLAITDRSITTCDPLASSSWDEVYFLLFLFPPSTVYDSMFSVIL